MKITTNHLLNLSSNRHLPVLSACTLIAFAGFVQPVQAGEHKDKNGEHKEHAEHIEKELAQHDQRVREETHLRDQIAESRKREAMKKDLDHEHRLAEHQKEEFKLEEHRINDRRLEERRVEDHRLDELRAKERMMSIEDRRLSFREHLHDRLAFIPVAEPRFERVHTCFSSFIDAGYDPIVLDTWIDGLSTGTLVTGMPDDLLLGCYGEPVFRHEVIVEGAPAQIWRVQTRPGIFNEVTIVNHKIVRVHI